jgi:hypothetical protein
VTTINAGEDAENILFVYVKQNGTATLENSLALS